MKKENNFTDSGSILKELESLKNSLEKLSKRISVCEKSVPEETKNAMSLVNSLARLKGKYKEYETIYNNVVSKTDKISGLALSAEKDVNTIRDLTNSIQEISNQANEIKD